MDLQSRSKWVEYSRAKDEMFRYTDIKAAPWWVVEADDKRRARLNCIAHLLSQIDYEDLTPPPIELPPRGEEHYVRPPKDEQTFVPDSLLTRRSGAAVPPGAGDEAGDAVMSVHQRAPAVPQFVGQRLRLAASLLLHQRQPILAKAVLRQRGELERQPLRRAPALPARGRRDPRDRSPGPPAHPRRDR